MWLTNSWGNHRLTRGNTGAPTYRVQSMRFDNVCLIVCIGGARVMVIVVIGSPAEHREHTRKHRGCHRRQKLEAQLILYRWPLVVYCFFLFFVGKNFAFHLNSLEISPSATFWTSRDHMVTSHGHRPWSQAMVTGVSPSPLQHLRAFIFIPNRVQRSHCSSIFVEFC